VAPAFDGAVSLYAGDTGAPLGTFVVPNRTINADFQSDGHALLVTSHDDAIYTWDPVSSTPSSSPAGRPGGSDGRGMAGGLR
jgi:hypothetical protein